MAKIIKCTDCLYNINVENDPFCMVTPHGARYSHKEYIPLCPDCRMEQGYDIRAHYNVLTKVNQPELPKLTHHSSPRPEQKPFNLSELVSGEQIVNSNLNSNVEEGA